MAEEFKPGETVPESGIYKVVHDAHAEPHEVTCVKGEPFPPCNACGTPRFVLVRAAHHIGDSEHFKKK